VQTPVRLIPTLNPPSATPGSAGPTPRQTLAALAEPADNGACSLSVVVDSEQEDLYVALAGDCRAVAGWEKNGVWRCDVLTEDQMGENEREVQR
jgi:pyruvate dehydrogenase phosphatase